MQKFWTHLKLKNGDQVKFVPPAPNGDQLGGVTQEERENIGLLKEEIANKLTKPSTAEVGKYFRVASIDAEGNPVLEAVDLPIATYENVGLVKPNVSYLTIKSDGTMGLNVASETTIDRRSIGRPLDAGIINYAVKASLTDSNRITMTDGEKSVACQTIGAEMPLRHIRLVTINDAGISDININTDENGNAFALTEIEIYAYVGATSGTKTISLAINTSKTETTGGYNMIKVQNPGNNNMHAVISKRTYWRAFAELSGVGGEAASQTPGNTFVSNRGASGVRNNEWSTASQIAINIDATTFPVGTNFDIWGR